MTNGLIARLLLAILAFGLIGTLLELLLLGHTDGWQQWVPVALLSVTLPPVLLLLRRPTGKPIAVTRWLMLAWLVSGLAGVLLHYRGNVEFARELTPDSHGWQLFKAAMGGATPALAPGTMIWFALLGLVAVRLLAADNLRPSNAE